jgi:colanic acid/amylovoran biosynthesis glycosyltransferase
VGAGPYLEAVAFARHQLGVEPQAHLLGALPPAEVKEKMQQADVLLHAGISEGFCNAVLEAQAMMLPVVCSDADGLLENVMDGETGFIVPRRNPAALAEKLALLAADPQQRQSFGAAGRRRVLSHFQVSDQLDAFERLYRQVLSDRAGVPAFCDTGSRSPQPSPPGEGESSAACSTSPRQLVDEVDTLSWGRGRG